MVSPPGDWTFRGGFQISQDGRSILATVLGKEGGTALYMHSLTSGSGAILPGTAGGALPFWSADGKALLFISAGQLKRLDLGSANPVSVTRAYSIFGVDWNRNTILLGTFPGPIKLVPAPGVFPSLSPGWKKRT